MMRRFTLSFVVSLWLLFTLTAGLFTISALYASEAAAAVWVSNPPCHNAMQGYNCGMGFGAKYATYSSYDMLPGAGCWAFVPGIGWVCPAWYAPCCKEAGAEMIIEDIFEDYRQNFIMGQLFNSTYTGHKSKPQEKSMEKHGFIPMTTAFTNAWGWYGSIWGSFFDASNHINATRAIQVQNTDTLQNYAPSEQICRFGTMARTLAASDYIASTNQLILSEHEMARNIGTLSSVGASGRGDDNFNRLDSFEKTFCDLADNRNGLKTLCGAVEDDNLNMDVDFARTLDDKPTVNVNLTDTTLTYDEAKVIGLSHYLYGHTQPGRRLSKNEMEENDNYAQYYQEFRSIAARRAAAQNSYAAIVGLRSAGSGAANAFVVELMKQLGLTEDNVKFFTNNQSATSYDAQMEILTKKIYEDPDYYHGLMQGKANIKRVSTAMSSIELMQDRDIYKSMTRSEMLLAILLELEARKISNNISSPRIGED